MHNVKRQWLYDLQEDVKHMKQNYLCKTEMNEMDEPVIRVEITFNLTI
jgi:hypothetical protein